MKKKIRIFFISLLLIVYTIPLMSMADDTNNLYVIYQDPTQNYRFKVKHLDDGRLPPDPGEMPEDFILKIPDNSKINNNLPKRASSFNELIVEIIQNLDDDLILQYLEDITEFGPRPTGSPACEQAGEYIYNEFESYGLEARYDDWTYSSYSGNNIEGTRYGIDETSDEIYIILAHYDSVSSSPGADDDGSGTAAVLAAAKLLSQYEFNHTVRFLAVDGEEQGLLGSYEYAEEAFNNGDNIVAVLNGDMIGYAENPTDASYIKIYEDSASEWITDITEEMSQIYNDYLGLTIVPSGVAYNSDHASFWDFDYNAIMYHEYNFNSYYHSSQDIIENMDINYSTRVSKLMLATLSELAEVQIVNLPPDKPIITGPSTGIAGDEITFSFSTTDPEGHDMFYLIDWGDGNNSGWIGPYASGETGEATHIFQNISEYDIKVQAKDIKYGKSEWSDNHHIIILENTAPEKPIITGPNFATTGKELYFEIVANDPNDHDLYYYVYWDDGSFNNWEGPYKSGEEVTFNHTFSKGGSFTIVSKARDTLGKSGPQNEFKIFILKNRASTQLIFLPLLEKLIERFPILYRLLY
ncbi:MAG: M28 family peptidase [Thermoplasmatales archaeon]|nr:MAG: M28 family peptidase [Thermoplasmatales archaeon]